MSVNIILWIVFGALVGWIASIIKLTREEVINTVKSAHGNGETPNLSQADLAAAHALMVWSDDGGPAAQFNHLPNYGELKRTAVPIATLSKQFDN